MELLATVLLKDELSFVNSLILTNNTNRFGTKENINERKTLIESALAELDQIEKSVTLTEKERLATPKKRKRSKAEK